MQEALSPNVFEEASSHDQTIFELKLSSDGRKEYRIFFLRNGMALGYLETSDGENFAVFLYSSPESTNCRKVNTLEKEAVCITRQSERLSLNAAKNKIYSLLETEP